MKKTKKLESSDIGGVVGRKLMKFDEIQQQGGKC